MKIIFILSILLIMPFNQVVSADLRQDTRVLDIRQDADTPYASVMNIANNTTNNRFKNNELLVEDFVSKMGFDGGFSGSLLPPSRFQFNFANTSNKNENLVLAHSIEFQEKNLLSGASESWWRCPYYWNYSVSAQRDFDVKLSIYMVDDPRKANLTFPLLTSGNNNPAKPNNESHPSLVFERAYSNVGTTHDSNQTWTDSIEYLPVNDTWNISKTNLLNVGERSWLENTTEEHMAFNSDGDYVETDKWTGDFQYYNEVHYSFGWFNVSAPIYPNETYFVIWEVEDTDMGTNDAGSCWITASDIGRNSYYRSIIAWCDSSSGFNGTSYELPIDLDSAVIFRIGMGDGVTGMKLGYNESDLQDHTDELTMPSFEQAFGTDTDRRSHFTSAWTTQRFGGDTTTDSYAEFVNSNAKFYYNLTATNGIAIPPLVPSPYIVGQWSETIFEPDGVHLNLKATFGDLDNSYRGSIGLGGTPEIFQNAVMVVQFESTLAVPTNQFYFFIERTGYIHPTTFNAEYRHILWYRTSAGTFTNYNLAQNVIDSSGRSVDGTLPRNCYISMNLKKDDSLSTNIICIRFYNTDNPFIPVASARIPYQFQATSGLTRIRVGATMQGMTYFTPSPSAIPVIPSQPRVSIDKVSWCNRRLHPDWSFTGIALAGASYPYDSYEIGTPEYSESSPINRNIFVLEDTSTTPTSSHTYTLVQDQIITTISGARRYYVSCYYQMRFNDSQIASGCKVTLRLYISNNLGVSWSMAESVGTSVDSAWHQLATPLDFESNVNRIQIQIIFSFPAVSSTIYPQGDWKMAFLDNITIKSIMGDPLLRYIYYQEVNQDKFNSTNYLTFMLPFRHLSDPSFPPYVIIQFFDSTDSFISGSQRTSTVADWYDDFIMFGIKSSELIALSSDIQYAKIYLFNFGEDSYLFLHDRNSDGYVNSRDDYKFNHIFNYTNPANVLWETWFSPYYSLKNTEGQWTNADGMFTTEYFYFVRVYFVFFNGTDGEILEIRFYNVTVEDFVVFRQELTSFGNVYNNEEWLAYINVRNRPSFLDKIFDVFANFFKWLATTPLGQFLMAIGKFINSIITFIVTGAEWLFNLIIQAVVFIIAIAIYIFISFMFYKLTQFFILVSQGRIEEGIEQMSATSTMIISKLSGGRLG